MYKYVGIYIRTPFSHMYYVLLPLQPQSFAESRHALFYEGHIEKQKENFVMCGRNFEMRGYESFPFNGSFCEHCDDVRILKK